jgi:WD40 repeat protein/predicted Ser/Thr protein kinase
MADPETEPGDPGGALTERAPPGAPPLAHQLARAELKARLFGAPLESARIGRYTVLRKLGAGGMGVVYAAYDEQLDRKIAIKLVHPDRHDPDSRARTRREAQALARLSHPNVVQVYEVGEHEGQVYLAMEFVQGRTLRAWQTEAPRRWQDTLAMYLQAGKGLAAAHARGLVHRDFKPDNVLVDDEEGRPRVLDFGLARMPGTTDLPPGTGDSPVTGDGPARLTTPGAVLGTPAYMPPEQLAGGEADARSDVFSFCAALHEALHGVRPFAGEHRETLHAAILRGELQRPARAVEVPAWLRAMVESGLAADPGARWQAMDPLLTALARGPARRRRRALFIAGCLTATLLAVIVVLVARRDQQVPAVLDDRSAQVREELEQTRVARADEQRHGEARRLATLAGLRRQQDPVTGMLLALEAVALHTRADVPPIVEAEQALLDALDSVRSRPFLRPGAAVVDAVAESPDGRWLATGERDGSVTLWPTHDPRNANVLLASDGHAVRALAFARDGSLAVARAGDGVRVWTLPADVPKVPRPAGVNDVGDPTAPQQVPVLGARLGEPVRWDSPDADLRDLEWSPREPALLARAGDLAYVFRPGRAPTILAGHTAAVRRAAWSPDGAQLVTASADGSARVWPAQGGAACKKVFRLDGRRGLWSAEFAPDGRELVLASSDHTAAIVSLRDGTITRLRGHTGEVYAAAFSPDGERVITVAMDDSARVWDRDGSSTRVDLPGHGEALGGVRLGPDRNLLLGTPPGGAAWLWQIDRPGPPLVLHGHAGSVVAARFSADGRRILTASADGSARRWHFADDPNLLRGHDAGIDHASFAPDGRRIVTASSDGTTRVWHRDGRAPWLLRGHREGSEVHAAFSPDGLLLASAGSDGKARLWSLASDPPALLATLLADREPDAPLLDLAWSPDGQRLAIPSEDGRVHLVTRTPGAGRDQDRGPRRPHGPGSRPRVHARRRTPGQRRRRRRDPPVGASTARLSLRTPYCVGTPERSTASLSPPTARSC